MINIIFKTIYYYMLGSFISFLELPKFNQKLYFAVKSNNRISLKFPENSNTDLFITLRIFKRIIVDLFKKKITYTLLNSKENNIILDCDLSSIKIRDQYVLNLTRTRSGGFISKNNLISYCGILYTLFFIFLLIIGFVPILTLSFFHKRKYHYGLYLMEFIEFIHLIKILKKHKIKKIHYFSIYERASNLWAFLLMKFDIYINKIPSEVPLHYWNSIIIANELSVCFEYQKEEIDYFKKTIFVNKINTWAPERFLEAPIRFFEKNRTLNNVNFNIGFFSSGNWLREKINDANLGYNDKKNEEHLFESLIKYSKEKNLKILVMLHPLEKKEIHFNLVNNYYKKYIDNKTVFLNDIKYNSIETFDSINIGIALYSTLMFERLYFGFKTIIAPFGYSEFPLENSSLKNISAKNINELYFKIDENLNLSTNEFFIKNNLQNYTNYIV